MVNKKCFYMAAMLGLSGMAFASPVDSRTVAAKASAFWQQMGGKQDVVLTDVSAQTPFHYLRIFAAPQGGFVIMATDDVARPVLGYSLSQPFSAENMPEQLESWLRGYDKEIEQAVTLGYPSDPQWMSSDKSGSYTAVGPLLETLWDQGNPYNNLCPSGTPVGCAATMQAQIMKFWSYPAFGEGQHGYNSPDYGYLSADFGHTLYEWDLMPSIARPTDPATSRQAIATLFYHIGVSVNMNYNISGSGAQGFAGFEGAISTDNSFHRFFHYKNTLEVKYRTQYDDNDYRDIILEELSHRRPIAFQGVDLAVGGHAFVCDGNDTLGYLHFNFGWTGVGDGYYTIGAINPGIGAQGQLGDYRFNSDNAIIIKIEPDYAMRVSDTLMSVARTAGMDSVLFGIDETMDADWSVSCNDAWITIDNNHFARAGWVRFRFDENTTGEERVATLLFQQGSQRIEVRVVQGFIDSTSMCPVTVVMESTRGNGWQNGAYLSLESPSGYVYGTATLASGSDGSETIMVPDREFRSVWHSGGGTDRNINYSLRNQYGETMLNVEYAYTNGGTHTLASPCGHVGIADPMPTQQNLTLSPNPATDYVDLSLDEPIRLVEVCDLQGRTVLITRPENTNPCRLDIRSLPAGVYLVLAVTDIGTTSRCLIKQ